MNLRNLRQLAKNLAGPRVDFDSLPVLLVHAEGGNGPVHVIALNRPARRFETMEEARAWLAERRVPYGHNVAPAPAGPEAKSRSRRRIS